MGKEVLEEMKIVLDAGHGYQTKGKRSPNGMQEYEFNRAVAGYVKQILTKDEQCEVYFTHSDERDVPLSERVYLANSLGANLFVSIHANAFGDGSWSTPGGIETYVHSSKPKTALSLAAKLQERLIAKTGLANRGVKAANFQVLRATKCPAILLELGFMTNEKEAHLLKTESYRKDCATAIAQGIREHFTLR
ncbi:N-acetylmuramoyl-L-alanine amidase [Peribacillus sp. SCS-155]|uniref:N-acetylmuramoyl-L-alanine amidase family protein n=1 Tax=Peribacillus sedimenti TaxID=3115297 RepID=UPI003906C47E